MPCPQEAPYLSSLLLLNRHKFASNIWHRVRSQNLKPRLQSLVILDRDQSGDAPQQTAQGGSKASGGLCMAKQTTIHLVCRPSIPWSRTLCLTVWCQIAMKQPDNQPSHTHIICPSQIQAPTKHFSEAELDLEFRLMVAAPPRSKSDDRPNWAEFAHKSHVKCMTT